MRKILVVCVGNICRSPVAEAMFKVKLPNIDVQSAGMSAMLGHSADPMAAQIALANGIDISAHRGRQLASWMLQDADLVLVMETNHQKQLSQQYPLSRGKIRCLGEFDAPGDFGAAGTVDIADPYRQSEQAFLLSHERISRGVAAWVSRIVQLT
ncbi:Low molecular weight protein-tyrosine-phosphatase Ptp [Polaromonas vacuolata]|uniref:protein-tyrosine-phosphatase n=1 Tax=Polaromonas vacuolata TaxID=37448 RepID=A0A6H2H7A5_9BURK|nr:low molecular weight protein-tyrosine-phosphatase [Polaromonas vacuolata]QJC55762.1 Low molecular weight protein-tyrosine-phosphatase Ptp [Polaromonas vacuolata]